MIAGLGLAAVFFVGCADRSSTEPDPVSAEPNDVSASSDPVEEPEFGDLDTIFERGYLRVLVTPSRTSFFFDHREIRGFDVELMRAFRDEINSGRPKSKQIRLLFFPRPFGDLLPSLAAGVGDVALGGLTIIPSRVGKTVFTEPYLTGVDEVVVHHRSVTGLEKLEDLAGRTIDVRSDSSYVDHLKELAEDFRRRGLEPFEVRAVGKYLATEDILEMVNAGIVDVTVADRYLAEAWAAVLPDLVVCPDLVVHGNGRIAMAVRASDTELLEALNRFIVKNRKGSLLGNMLFTRYFEKTTWLKDPSAEDRLNRELIELFRKYAQRYGFHWLDIAAQAFRESRFDQSKISRAGAVGIMQVRPSTAADPNVGIKNIDVLENNIHAGVKYLRFLDDRYFSDPAIDDEERLNFAFAAYNAGPRRIVAARERAKEEGFDPDRWFDNVELIVARDVGREPVDYVREIHAYRYALRLGYEELLKRKLERRSLEK